MSLSSKSVMNVALSAVLAPVASLMTGGAERVLSSDSLILFVLFLVACTVSSLLADKKPASDLVSSAMDKGETMPAKTAKLPSALADAKRDAGQVKWFNSSKGFGFITRDDGQDIFVHFRSIRGDGRRFLRDGQRVDFVTGHGEKGLQAEDVVLLDKQ